MTNRIEIGFLGTKATLIALSQVRTYEGLLEGVPTRQMNNRKIQHLREQEPDGYIVPAEQRPIDLGRRYPFGDPAVLPEIQCVARLSGEGFTDRILWKSHLTVIWFQDAWCMPIDASVLEHLESVDWRAHASEYEI